MTTQSKTTWKFVDLNEIQATIGGYTVRVTVYSLGRGACDSHRWSCMAWVGEDDYDMENGEDGMPGEVDFTMRLNTKSKSERTHARMSKQMLEQHLVAIMQHFDSNPDLPRFGCIVDVFDKSDEFVVTRTYSRFS